MRALLQANHFYIVGGRSYSGSEVGTEQCTLVNYSNVVCMTLDPQLDTYSYYPEMMIVDENYCQK